MELHDLSAAGGRAALIERFSELAVRRFSLESGPLMRAAVARFDTDAVGLIVTVEHLVADALSMQILRDEVVALYTGDPATVPPHGNDGYAAYVAAEHERLGVERGELLEAWRERLAGAPVLAEVPLRNDAPAGPARGYRGDTVEHMLGPELAAPLDRLVRGRRATAFMAIVAGMLGVFAVRDGARHVSVVAPVAAREDEVEDTVGWLANLVIIRPELDPGESYGSLLDRVRADTIDALDASGLPFWELIEHLAPDEYGRAPAGTYLYADVWQDPPPFVFGDLEVSPLALGLPSWSMGLGVDGTVTAEGIELSCMYETTVFSAGQARAFMDDTAALLAAGVAEPSLPLRELLAAR